MHIICFVSLICNQFRAILAYYRLLAFDKAVEFSRADIGRCRDTDLLGDGDWSEGAAAASTIPSFIVTVKRPERRTTPSLVVPTTSAPVRQ